MDKKEIQEALLTLREIEKRISDLDLLFSNTPLFTRTELIEKIFQDIINNNEFLLSIEGNEDKLKRTHKERTTEDIFDFTQLDKLEGDQAKRSAILNTFIDNFEDISESDKKAILKSLTDKDAKEIKKDIIQLSKVFKLKDF